MPRLFCLGDSITDCGRLFDNPPLGCGYVQRLSEKFVDFNNNINIINCGTDGFTISRVLGNASADSFSGQLTENDIVTILIGINDIGLMMNTGRTEPQKQEMMNTFLHNYDSLIQIIRSRTSRLILMEPFIFPCPQEYYLWLPHIRTMSKGIQKLSESTGTPYILLHDTLNEIAASEGFPSVTTDGIHLTARGHELLADKLFAVISKFFS